MTFKMKKKPVKPKRKTYKREHWIHEFDSIQSIVDYLKSENINLEDAYLDQEYEECYLKYDQLQSEEEFNKSLDRYKEKLKEYKAWEKKNFSEIEIKKRENKERRLKEIDSKIDKTKKELEQLKKTREKI